MPDRYPALYVLFLCCALLCASVVLRVARAQDGVALPELTVTAPQEASPAPTTFHEVIRPATEARRVTSVADLIARTPGTMVRSLGSLGQATLVSIRGSSPEQVAVYLDGARLNTSGFGAVDLSTIPVEAIDRIEIIRGGGTAQFGPDAIGGVVHIVTKQAEPGRSTEATISGGSFFTNTAATSYRQSSKDQAIVASFAHHYSKGNYAFERASTNLAGTPISGGGTFRREHNRSLAESFLIKLDRPFDHGHWNVTNNFFFTDRELPGTEFEATQLAPLNPLEATQRLYRNNTHASVTWEDLATERLNLEVGIDNVFEWSGFRDPSPALGPAIDRLSLSDGVNPYVRGDYLIPTQDGGHTLTLRYDYRRDMFDDRARNSTTTAGGFHARNAHLLLAQEEWRLLHDRCWIIPAFRLSHTSDFGTAFNGRLGLIARPIPTVRLKANIETAYRVPTFTELYHPDQGFIRGNPDLEEERAWHWDAGVAVELPHFQSEVAYFQQHIDNSILFVPISATTIAPINTFKVRSDGIEVTARATPTDFVTLSANYTWLRAHFTSTGNQLPGRPRHKANARLELAHRLGAHWHGTVFSDVQWVSQLPINVENTTFLAGRATLDLGLKTTWKTRLTHEYTAGIEVNNITNIQIYDSLGFPLPRRAIYITFGGKWG